MNITTIFPGIEEYWSSKNGISLDLAQGTVESKFWFKCEKGHEFYTEVGHLKKAVTTSKSKGCPYCSGRKFKTGYNDVKTVCPEMLDWWNDATPPTMVKISEDRTKYSFKCKNDHEFQQKTRYMYGYFIKNKKFPCPYCSGRKVCNDNSLASNYPELLQFLEDDSVDPNSITSGSECRLNWVCSKGHHYTSRVKDVVYSYVNHKTVCCPYCHGKAVKEGETDLFSFYPELKPLWDYNKNPVDPESLYGGVDNRKLYWWICSKGHSFERTVKSLVLSIRNEKEPCPECKLQKESFYNSKDLIKLWADENLDPREVSVKDNTTIVEFQCPEGHRFRRTAYAVLEKARKKNTTDYKQICPICTGVEVQEGFNDMFSIRPDLRDKWNWSLNSHVDPYSLAPNSLTLIKDVCKEPGCNNVFELTVCDWTNGYMVFCDDHRGKRSVSLESNEMIGYIKSLGVTVVEEFSPVNFNTYRVDVYIPDKKIAIDFNGIYWHSDEYRPHTYHRDKLLFFKSYGIRLIYVWEDDWLLKRNIVCSMLKNILGVSQSKRINARDCSVHNIGSEESRQFMEQNHIQGFSNGSFYLGLKTKEGYLVASITCKYENGGLNIVRYATNCLVRGGFSLLVSYIEKTYKYKYLYTFSDNGISQGNLYQMNGFTKHGEIPPDYMYVYKNVRRHKFGFRKERFFKDSNLIWKDGLSERELAELNKIHRVWDAGKTRWVKRNPYFA